MHRSVLLEEVIETLNIKQDGLYIDATAGEGGHAEKILEKGGKVLLIDWDTVQCEKLERKFQGNEKVIIVNDNYANIENIAKESHFFPVDGVLFDYGLSMEQLGMSGKGFSYQKLDEPLDMRLNEKIDETAEDLINSLNQNELYELFSKYAEELFSLPISEAIVRARTLKKIKKVRDLLTIIDQVLAEKHVQDKKGTYSRVFQALRVVVNNEFDNIKNGLQGAVNCLKSDGVIIAITFHSLEDRIVKMFVRKHNLRFKKDLVFGDRELKFERSAKLRVITKT